MKEILALARMFFKKLIPEISDYKNNIKLFEEVMEREPENKKINVMANKTSKLGVKRNEESQSREQNVKAQETKNKSSGNKGR